MQTAQTFSSVFRIERGDKLYPAKLNDLSDPPRCLYACGSSHLLLKPMIAIVGSRKASPEGLENAKLFAQALSDAGLVIISGLAKGVDGVAHQATLNSGLDRFTTAVCGTGIDIVYPVEHHNLAESIRQRGLLLSELPLGTPPKAHHFPKRNRIIAALSLGVIVVEAAKRSGSLITARIANELGREVFAIPGSIRNPQAAGCNFLIQQGAKLVQHPNDVLEELIY